MLFPPPGLNILAGEYGCQKTTLALDLAVCAALGQPWLGLPVTQAPVLYIDNELGFHQFLPRVRAALLGHHAAETTPFHFTSGFDVTQPGYLAADAAQVSAKFVILDSLPFFILAGTNVVRSPLPSVLLAMQTIAQDHGLSVFAVLHATRRGLRRALLPLSIFASSVLWLQRSHDQLHLQSLSPASDPLDLHATINTRPDQTWLSLAPPSPSELSPLQSAILAHLHQRGPSSIRSLTHATQASLYRVTKAVYRLRTAGFIRRADPGSRGQAAAYTLTPRGHTQAQTCQVHTRWPWVSRNNNFSSHPAPPCHFEPDNQMYPGNMTNLPCHLQPFFHSERDNQKYSSKMTAREEFFMPSLPNNLHSSSFLSLFCQLSTVNCRLIRQRGIFHAISSK